MVNIEPDGEWLWIVGLVIGAWLGGAKANGGNLNPFEWDWGSWDTWKGIIGGGAMGAVMGGAADIVILGKPFLGITRVAIGWGTGLGSAGLAINQYGDTDFYWETSAGGGGSVNISKGNAPQKNKNGIGDTSEILTQKNVNIYVETDGLGHTYIEVNGTVFSYGRYNGSYSPSSGRFGPVGEGILLKKEEVDAQDYINNRSSRFSTNVFTLSDLNTNAIYNYYNAVYNGGVASPAGGRYIDTYFLFGNNCTTLVCRGLREGGGYFPIFQTPLGLSMFLRNLKRMKKGWNPGALVPWEPKY